MAVMALPPGSQALALPGGVLEFLGTNIRNHCPQEKPTQLCRKELETIRAKALEVFKAR